MTNTRPLILAAALLALASTTIDAQARAGGGVSVGRSSSVSSSSSRAAPSYRPPSYTSPAAPEPRYTPPRPRTEPSRSSSSGFGGSFVGGMAGSAIGTMVGNAISRPDVVVAPGAAVAAPAAAAGVAGAPMVSAAPTVIERPLIGAGGLLLLLAAGAGGVWWWTRRRDQAVAQYHGHIPPHPVPARPDACSPLPVEMDPVVLFYRVQQAAMDDDRQALDRYCTQGLALLLSGSPEPGRHALSTLTSMTWRDDSHIGTYERAVVFSFTDKVTGESARERWIFDDAGMLAGIEVL